MTNVNRMKVVVLGSPRVGKSECLLININYFLTFSTYEGVKLIIKVLSIILWIYLLFPTYCFIVNFSVAFFLQYSPFFFYYIYAATISSMFKLTCANLFAAKDNTAIITRKYFKSASQKTCIILEKAIRKVNTLYAILFFSACLGFGITTFNWITDIKKYILIPENFIPTALIQWAIFIVNIVILIPTLACPMYLIHTLFYIKVRFTLLSDYVLRLNKNLNQNEEKSNNWQLSVYINNQLRNIAKRHLEIQQYQTDYLKSNQLIFMTYIINGTMIGLKGLIGFFSPEYSLIMAVVDLSAFFTFLYILCFVVEDYIRAASDLQKAIYEINWYNWNLKCQKTYSILLNQFSRDVSFPIFLLFNIGNELFKKIARGLYAFGGFLYSVRK